MSLFTDIVLHSFLLNLHIIQIAHVPEHLLVSELSVDLASDISVNEFLAIY